MHFSLFFQDDNSHILPVYQMAYIPSIIWHKNGEELPVPIKSGPYFQKGDSLELVRFENIDNSRQVAIIAHEGGHGTNQDFYALIDEIKAAGFTYRILM